MSLLSLKEQAEVVFQQVEILEKVQLLEWEKGRDCVELEAQLVGKNFSPFGGGVVPFGEVLCYKNEKFLCKILLVGT